MLEWTNPECPFVRKHYNSNNMQSLQKEWGAKDVVWLAINSTNSQQRRIQDGDEMAAWMRDESAAPKATLIDGTSAVGPCLRRQDHAAHVRDRPDRHARLQRCDRRQRSTNLADAKAANNYVRAALTEATAGKPVTVASTMPYGCSVKY